jgi:predicted dehydrogenase
MNRILMVNQDYRHIPMFRRLRAELSRHPDVGADMMHVQFFRSFVPGPGSFRHQMENIFLWDMAVHHMDLLRYVLNDEIREVYATSFRPRWSWLNGNAAISAIMRTAKNTRISYDGGLVYISDREPWEGRWWVETPEAAYRVDSGRSGYGLYRQKRLFGGDDKASVRARAPRLLSRYEPRTIARLSESLRAFAEAVHTREEPATSAADNLKTIAILDAIIESSESGMPVNVKPPVLIP